uniref:Molybdopterin molybdochelatase (Modular protein) n=1 Tax=mine drainage metagenome TaxID=410659 RepID=E6QMQ1_9ZZZZ
MSGNTHSPATNSLIRYGEAVEQVHRYLAAYAAGVEVPVPDGHPVAQTPAQTLPPVFSGPAEPQESTRTSWHGSLSGGTARPPIERPGFLPDFLGAGQSRSVLPGGQRLPVSLPLAQSPGRVLSIEIRADRDLPAFPRSTRDGFACRAADANSHQFLFLAGRVQAGQVVPGQLGPGEAWEIMTGATVPEGADAVMMIEHAEQSSNFIRLVNERQLAPGENIVAQGAEARAGEVLVPASVRITSAQIALAAQNGYRELMVTPRPRIAILTTGDELVPIEQRPGPGQIRNSNAPMLAAMVTAMGAEPILLPTACDRPDALDESLRRALGADLLLISGGISVGKFDLVEDALTRADARFFFGGVAIQPGKPVAFGQLPRAGQSAQSGNHPLLPLPFFALPGNPISSAVTFHLFAAPLIAGLTEDSGPQPRFALAQLVGNWRGTPGLTRFLPAACDFAPSPTVRLVPWQGSGDLAAYARSNCFVVIPEDAQTLPEGGLVQILLT